MALLAAAALDTACGAKTGLQSTSVVVPRAIAPLSTSTVTNWRPTLAWTLPPSSRQDAPYDAVRVELCRDPGCVHVTLALDATGLSVRPPDDLAPGMWFWRLRTVRGGVAFNGSSPIWEFRVRPRNTPTDTSWGTIPDFDRDGFADIATNGSGVGVLCPGAPSGAILDGLFVYRGGPGLSGSSQPVARLLQPGTQRGVGSPVPVGDVNGDGYADLIAVPAPRPSEHIPIAVPLRLYPGGADGVLATNSFEIGFDGASAPAMGYPTVTPAGDVNRDGYADVVVRLDSGSFVYEGGPDGLSVARAMPIAPAFTEMAAAGIGDVDGDGFGDVATAVFDGAVDQIVVSLHRGTLAGLDPAASTVATVEALNHKRAPPAMLRPAGDLDGDGYADLAVALLYVPAGAGSGIVWIHDGSAAGLSTTPAATLTGSGGSGAHESFGWVVVGDEDVNGDGITDLVVAATSNPAADGRSGVVVFWGATAGVRPVPDQTIGWPDAPFHQSVGTAAGVGDVNGDGIDDVIIYWPYCAAPWTAAPVYLGSAAGLASTPFAALLP